jgi:hypothetical protein
MPASKGKDSYLGLAFPVVQHWEKIDLSYQPFRTSDTMLRTALTDLQAAFILCDIITGAIQSQNGMMEIIQAVVRFRSKTEQCPGAFASPFA